ncbi:c-type cytochrome [Oceaniserpentilla sp. 4NH20-0058]
MWAEELADAIQQLERVKANQVDYLIALEDGKDRSMLCGYCHGKDGNSVKPEIPNLAGQNPEYLLKQFSLFAAGERKNYVMEQLSKSISIQEKIEMALYFSAQSVIPKSDAGNTEHGKSVYNGICVTCHGANGLGDKELPRLAGQNKEFVIKTLTDFKSGKSKRASSPMFNVMKSIKQSDIDHLARYISSM